MTRSSQAGFTLVEAAIATAVLAIASGGALFAFAAFGRYAAHQAGPMRTAAVNLAEQTLRVAQDAWKYGAPGNAPAGSATATVPVIVPRAAATTVPLTVTTALANVTATQAQISVTVSYPADGGHPGETGTASVTGYATVKAPLPGSRITDPAAIPQPSGAP